MASKVNSKFRRKLSLNAQRDPDELVAAAYAQRGHIFFKKGEYERSREDYETALRLKNQQPEALYGLGKYYQVKGKNKEAEKSLTGVVAFSPQHCLAHYSLGAVYENLGEWKKALEKYQTAISIDESLACAYLHLGGLYCRKTSEYEKAIEYLSKARDLGDESDYVLFHLGLAYAKSGEYEKAISVWEELIEAGPENDDLKINIANAYYLSGRKLLSDGKPEEAIKAWESYLDYNKYNLTTPEETAAVYYTIGREMLRAGDDRIVPRAKEVFHKALKLEPKNINCHIGNCFCCLCAGTYVEIDPLICESRELLDNSKHSRATLLTALCDYLRSDEQKRKVALRKAQSLINDKELDTPLKNHIQLILIYEEAMKGDYKKAADKLSLLLEENEINGNLPFPLSVFNRFLAYFFIKAYGKEEAAKRLKELNSSGIFNYAVSLLNILTGQEEKALSEFEKIHEKYREDRKVTAEYANLLCHIAAKRAEEGEINKAFDYLKLGKAILAGVEKPKGKLKTALELAMAGKENTDEGD